MRFRLLHGFDAVLDTVGGETYTRSYRVLKPGGVLVSMIEQPDPGLMAEHRVRAVLVLGDPSTAWLDRLAGLVDRGVLRPYVDRAFTLDEVRQAFEYLESGHPQGKVVVRVR